MRNSVVAGVLIFIGALAPAGLASADDVAPAATQNQPAKKTEASGCDHFSWPIDRERAWFEDSNLTHRASGVRLSKIDRAVDLALQPTKDVKFFLAPERAPKPDSYSGDVTFRGVPRPGTYQVTVSDEAWIDVFQNGARMKSTAFTGAKDCPGVRKSVRFELAPGDLVLVQISNAAKDEIKVAFDLAP